MIYTFISADGRRGEGQHPHGAMVAALGRAEVGKIDLTRHELELGRDACDFKWDGDCVRLVSHGKSLGKLYRKQDAAPKKHPFSRDYNGIVEFPKSGRQRGEGDG